MRPFVAAIGAGMLAFAPAVFAQSSQTEVECTSDGSSLLCSASESNSGSVRITVSDSPELCITPVGGEETCLPPAM